MEWNGEGEVEFGLMVSSFTADSQGDSLQLLPKCRVDGEATNVQSSGEHSGVKLSKLHVREGVGWSETAFSGSDMDPPLFC